jgi:pyruvate dehydrogenase E2 component (dihydrolipoamide acetyltransferase)
MSTPILMPALSPTMEEGTLAKWHVKPGDHVSPGDVIAEIETDKATMEVEAVDEGVIGKLLVAEGAENVKVQTPIAEMLGGNETASPAQEEPPKPATQKAASPKPDQPATNTPATAPAPKPTPAKTGGGERMFASPLARRLAERAGLDLSSVHGSGPHGRIVKADIEAAAAAPRKAAPQPAQELATLKPSSPERPANNPYKPEDYTLTPLDGMRKTIARRMTQSFQEVPHFSLNIDVEMERLLEARKQLNARLEHENIKLSINDILIRASALALKKSPEANVSFMEGALLKHKHAHVAVAVAVPGGLLTPVIFQAETKGLGEISREMAALAEKARARKLQPTEYEGGTFTISNLGMYGIKNFTSIINEPQSMILSVGAGEQRAIVKNGAVAIATMVTLTLTCDHRAVDGAIGAEFLSALRGFVEDPMTMML